MKIPMRPLFISLFILSTSLSLHADAQGDAAAEQRRLDSQRQEQNIQDNKLEDQRIEDRRQEQQIQDRKLDDRRAEQRRLDNARQRLSVGGHANYTNAEIADRGRGGGSRDRRNSLRDDQDLMDDTVDEMMLERLQNQEQFHNEQQYQPQAQAQAQAQAQSQYSCPGPGCTNQQTGQPGCGAFNCQDPQALHKMEANMKQKEENHQQRKLVVEQWDRDHSRD